MTLKKLPEVKIVTTISERNEKIIIDLKIVGIVRNGPITHAKYQNIKCQLWNTLRQMSKYEIVSILFLY